MCRDMRRLSQFATQKGHGREWSRAVESAGRARIRSPPTGRKPGRGEQQQPGQGAGVAPGRKAVRETRQPLLDGLEKSKADEETPAALRLSLEGEKRPGKQQDAAEHFNSIASYRYRTSCCNGDLDREELQDPEAQTHKAVA